MSRPVLVLCPMRIERDHVARALRRAGDQQTRLVQTGIGKHAIIATLEREAAGPAFAPGTLFVLAGAAGGLAHAVDDAPPIVRVIDTNGRSWTPASPVAPDGLGVTLVGVDHIVEGPADKHALHARTGAAVVDMESHAFAEFCDGLGLPWCVVRGVSDTPDQTLPARVLSWIDPAGNTRSARAAIDLLLNPSLVPHIVGVVRRSNRVLPRVGQRVATIASAWRAATHP